MVVNTAVGKIVPHVDVYILSGTLKKRNFTGGFELQQGGTEDKSPGPIGPAAAAVTAVHGYNRCTPGVVVIIFQAFNLTGRIIPETTQGGKQDIRG